MDETTPKRKAPKKIRGTVFKDGSWWARIKSEGKEVWRSCDTQAQATAVYGGLLKARREQRLFDTKKRYTLEDVSPLYWKAFKVRRRVDSVRAKGIIENHLLPFFGGSPLDGLKPEDGLSYVVRRQQEGATAGTIRREWQVLMRMINLAVGYDKLDKNRLKKVDLPEAAKRERVAESEELARIPAAREKGVHTEAMADVWRAVIAAANTGLREGKLLTIQRMQIRKGEDGHWLTLSPARTRLKGNPIEIPLNASAAKALLGGIPSISDERVLRRWDNARAFGKYWDAVCTRAKIVDLHFHDLRHTFATRLQRIGIDYEVRQALLGHKMPGMTAQYSHGGPEWRAKLRDAVDRLDRAYPMGESVGKCVGDETPFEAAHAKAIV